MDVVRFLAEQAGPRPAGGEGEARVLAFLEGKFSGIGLRVRRESFAFRSWESDGEWTLAFEAGGRTRRVRAVPLPYTAAPLNGGLRGSLEWEGEWPLIPGRFVCPRFALRVDGEVVAAVVGMPTGDARPLPNPNPLFSMPTIVIGAEETSELRELANEGERVEAKIVAGSIREGLRRSSNIVADHPSSTRNVTVIAHFDCVEGSPGANDNASGVSVLLRLARRFARSNGPLGFRFILAGAEEPFLVGSRSYVGNAAMSGELRQCVAALNLDMVAIGERFSLRCVPSAFWSHVRSAVPDTSKAGVPFDETALYAASDHWAFHEVGIESAQLTREADPQWHSPSDEAGRFGEDELADAEDLAAQILEAARARLAGARSMS